MGPKAPRVAHERLLAVRRAGMVSSRQDCGHVCGHSERRAYHPERHTWHSECYPGSLMMIETAVTRGACGGGPSLSSRVMYPDRDV